MIKKLLTLVSILLLTSSFQIAEIKVSKEIQKTIDKQAVEKAEKLIDKKATGKTSILEVGQAKPQGIEKIASNVKALKKKQGLERLESEAAALKKNLGREKYCKQIAITNFTQVVIKSVIDDDKQLEEIAKKAALDTLNSCIVGEPKNNKDKMMKTVLKISKYLLNKYKGDDKAEVIEFQQDDFQ